jgi:hypothetical protein
MVSLISRLKRRWMAMKQDGADRPRDKCERKDRKGVQCAFEPVREREEHRREHQHRSDRVDEEVEIFGGAADDHADGDVAGAMAVSRALMLRAPLQGAVMGAAPAPP